MGGICSAATVRRVPARALAAGLLVALLLPAQAARATFPGADGPILGVRDDTGIISVAPDGTVTPLGQPRGHMPKASPSGMEIAFIRSVPDGTGGRLDELWVMDRSGSARRRLAGVASGIIGELAWSPNGQWLAYTEEVWGATEDTARVHVIRRNGADHRPLTGMTANIADLTWAPGSGRIAYTRFSQGKSTVWWVSRDGAQRLRVTDPSLRAYAPDWSPTQQRLTFVQRLPDSPSFEIRTAIMTVQPNGANLRQRTNGSRWEDYPAWSPDGTKIAFTTTGPADIWVMGGDGSGQTNLTGASAVNVNPAREQHWSPSSDTVVFLAGRHMRTVDVATGTVSRVALSPTYDGATDWAVAPLP